MNVSKRPRGERRDHRSRAASVARTGNVRWARGGATREEGVRRESATLCNETRRTKTRRRRIPCARAARVENNVDDPAVATGRFLVREPGKIQMKLAQVLPSLSLSRSARPRASTLSRERDVHERTMAATADAWCFAVDARFERNGVMSSTTFKCVRIRGVANPRPAASSSELLPPRVFESSRGREVEKRRAGGGSIVAVSLRIARRSDRDRKHHRPFLRSRRAHVAYPLPTPASSAIGLC